MGLPASALQRGSPSQYRAGEAGGDGGGRGGVWVDVLSVRVTPPCPSASHSLANVMPGLGVGGGSGTVWRDQSGCVEIKKKNKKKKLVAPRQFWRRDAARKSQNVARRNTQAPASAHLLCSSEGWGLRSFCQMAQGLLICRRLTALRVRSKLSVSLTHTHT